MRLLRLHLKAFGPFTDRVLDFGPEARGLVLVHGPNEAGKSSALRAMTDLRFGIPQQSADNFVHPHPEMRVGGEFVDRSGRRHALLRRKGRAPTLFLTDFADPAAPLVEPAPPELESLLTSGLDRAEYETGFALDHRRLREGGRALLEGEGEIGAALFEASAGVRSIPRILERIDQSARRFFMPGARGRNARINEALRALDESQAAFRQALVRPSQWAELSKKHRAAADALAGLEARQRELLARLQLIGELRAVAPLLATLDHAGQVLDALRDAPLLAETAAGERAAAESGLATAREDADAAAAEAERQRRRLAGLAVDRAVLDVAPAVRRLIASSEAIDRYRAELAAAGAELAAESRRIEALASRLDPLAGVDAVLARAPDAARRTGIEQAVRALERAEDALAQHRADEAAEAPSPDSPEDARLPSPESRIALRTARSALTRHEPQLQRLAGLPAEVEAARRALATALADAGLPDEAALRKARPLLDARIDEEISAERRDATRREEHEHRLARIAEARGEEVARRDAVLAGGEVPTQDQVAAARARRDEGWRLILGTCVERTIEAASPSIEAFTGGRPLPRAYEEAVAQADLIADALAADHERAAQLQACQREIAKLDRDAGDLRRQLEAIALGEAERAERWRRALADAGLPDLPPAALRDWQARLAQLRRAQETLQALVDEREAAIALAERLAASLREAILGTGLAAPPADAGVDTLAALADEIEERCRQAEKRLDTERGQRAQREQQRQLRATREAALREALGEAREALREPLSALMLAPDATPAVIRARLEEFDTLLAARDRALAAEAGLDRARESLALLEGATGSLATALGDETPADLRIYVERLATRLDEAEAAAREHALASQALAGAQEILERQRAAIARHEATFARLCEAAGVASPAALPEAEARAQRKREAQAAFDRASAQLAQASRRPIEALREHLAGLEPGRLDADEAQCARDLAGLEDALRDARRDEETARHALRAIDGADTAATAREAMEQAAARIRADMPAWMRSRLAHALLAEATRRFRERAQGPMLRAATALFERMTGGEFARLVADDSAADRPVLLAERRGGRLVHVDAMSEGTRDQLYLSLRLAALGLRREAGIDLPVVLDDVLMTSDDARAARMLEAIADFAEAGQAIVFTHHRHLAELARATLAPDRLTIVELGEP
ncbi:AAA family ATPase [Burkholderiaceae bacterium FT117]|uniref:ATP-binding protein n=1 Tax=Zeimonas sediminis TaxID=2944268 RepID=UPI002343227A|nr:YhaN family protein [Zeimonas sediminis]MCM5569844.1 AAA family ATPase [Zeimonas sediminis]